jgi:hypothetical protein
MSSLFNDFFGNHGVIWTLISTLFSDCLSSFVLTYCDRKGLNLQQAAFATRIYKQHHRVGTMAEVLEAMCLQEEPKKALDNL